MSRTSQLSAYRNSQTVVTKSTQDKDTQKKIDFSKYDNSIKFQNGILSQLRSKKNMENNFSIYLGKPYIEQDQFHIMWEIIFTPQPDQDNIKFPYIRDTLFGDVENIIDIKEDVLEAQSIQSSIGYSSPNDQFPLKKQNVVMYPGFIEYEPYLEMSKNDIYVSKQELDNMKNTYDTDSTFMKRVYFNYSSGIENNSNNSPVSDTNNPIFVFLTSPIFCQTLFKPVVDDNTKSPHFKPVTESDMHMVMCEFSKKYDCLSIDINSAENIAKFYNDHSFLEMLAKIDRIFDPDNKPNNKDLIDDVKYASEIILFFLKASKLGSNFSKYPKKRDLVIVSNTFSTHFALSLSGCRNLLLETQSIKVVFLSDTFHPFKSFIEEKSFTESVLKSCDFSINTQYTGTSETGMPYKDRFNLAKDFISGLAAVAIDRYNYISKSDKKLDFDSIKSFKTLNNIKSDSDEEILYGDNEDPNHYESDSENTKNTNSSSHIKNKSDYFGLDDEKILSMDAFRQTKEFEYFETRFSRIISGTIGSLAFLKFRSGCCRNIKLCMDKMLIEAIFSDIKKIFDDINTSSKQTDKILLQVLKKMENDFDNYESQINDLLDSENEKNTESDDFTNISKTCLESLKLISNKKTIIPHQKVAPKNIDDSQIFVEDALDKNIKNVTIEYPKYIFFKNIDEDNTENFGENFMGERNVKLDINLGIIECIEKPFYVFQSILSSLEIL